MMRKWILCGPMMLAVVGCSKTDSDTAEAPTTAPLATSPGAAPSYGKPSGMGFSTGDAIHTDGQGSGMMGYHGTGAMGTSGAITDRHEVPAPPAAATTEPVLPAP